MAAFDALDIRNVANPYTPQTAPQQFATPVRLPQQNDASNPALQFGDGDTGFEETSDDVLQLAFTAAFFWLWSNAEFRASGVGGGPTMRREAMSDTNPGFTRQGQVETGVGIGASHVLHLIANSVEAFRVFESAGNPSAQAAGGIGAFATAPPTVQPAKINDPSGGATQDAEARTAINAIIDILEGAGFSSAT